MKTTKGRVATEVFPDRSVKTTRTGAPGQVGVTRIENNVSLVPLRVLLDSEDPRFTVGSVVYVRGDLYTQQWAKVTHTNLSPEPCILVPDTCIEAWETP